MPELPEVEAITRELARDATGKRIDRCELAALSALKTYEPPIEALIGKQISSSSRRGKFICVEIEDLWLVLHLARGGWVRLRAELPQARARLGRSPLALRLGFAGGGGVEVTEMGHEKRLAIYVVRDPAEVAGVARLGPDPLDPSFDTGALQAILAQASGTLKAVLCDQSLIGGVGNAYSDEALHVARLSPFKPAAKLDADEVRRLHVGLVELLSAAVERSAGLGMSELKGDKKSSMRVHGRTGQACPECGEKIREISFATKSWQYCPKCQTGGKVLADRRLSRLLK
jgi:formamidopyrimidine-DNA glycosylase